MKGLSEKCGAAVSGPPPGRAALFGQPLESRAVEVSLLLAILAAQAFLFARPIHSAANYDEGVYLAALDALRHGQALGSDVFAAQFPGFYDLLRLLALGVPLSVTGVRAGLLAVVLCGTVGGFLVGRRFGGPVGGLLAAAFLVVAPPLDLFSFQVIADTPALALTALALGLATLAGPVAAVAAGALFACGLSVKLSALTALPVLVFLVRRRPLPALGGFAFVATVLLGLHASAIGELYASGVTYHREARSTPTVIPHPHRQMVDQIPLRTPFFWLVLAAVVVGLGFAARRSPLRVWPLWTWVALAVAFLLVHAPLHYNHLVLFPFALAVAAGSTLGAALPRRPLVLGAAALALAAAYVQQVRRVEIARPPEPATNVEAAHALERLIPASARTIDDRPLISFLAHRRVDGPLVDIPFLRFETGSLDDAKVIARLPQVRAVVVSRALRTRPRVLAAVRRTFDSRYDRGGVAIWVRRR